MIYLSIGYIRTESYLTKKYLYGKKPEYLKLMTTNKFISRIYHNMKLVVCIAELFARAIIVRTGSRNLYNLMVLNYTILE